MNQLESIIEYDIIRAAHDSILMAWDREREIVEQRAAEGKPAPIATYRRDKYRRQLDLLEAIMIEMEDE